MVREQLVEARKERGLSQEKAAEILEVSTATLNRWERGHCAPHPGQLERICKLYNRDALSLGFVIHSQKETPMSEHLARSMNIDLTGKIIKLVWSWTGSQYQDLQSQISQEIRAYNDIPLTRRQALTSVILLPIGIQAAKQSTNETLAQIAAGITACWYERRGTDLQTAHDATSVYIAQLQNILPKCTERQRQAAAEMIMQCCVLKGTLTRHLQGNDAAIQQIQQAFQYSKLTRNNEQKILAIRTIAGMHSQNNNGEQALLYGEQAAAGISGGNLLTQSYIYSGLANYQASQGKVQDALKSLDKANQNFFAQSSKENAPIWIDHSMVNLNINASETYLHLGEFQKAAEIVDQAISLHISLSGKGNSLFGRVNVETVRDDKIRDQELAINTWSQGLGIAKDMKSKFLLREAKAAYQLMRAAWPTDKRIKDLWEQIH